MRHPWGAAFELIVKSKDRFTPCGCHHVIYLLASHRNPKDEDPPAAWHPDRGARFLDRMSRGVAPKTPGYQWIPLSPTTPLGCRTDCLTGKCDTLAGSYISLGVLFSGVFGTSCLDTRSKKR